MQVWYPRVLIPMLGLAACGEVEAVTADASNDAAPDGSVLPEARCSDLPLTCGPDGTSSCCDSKVVPGGTFLRGFDQAGGLYTSMAYPAQVTAFRLDTYEVTVGRFRQFVAAGYGTRANPPAAGAGARRLNGVSGQGGWDPAWNSKLAVDEPTLRSSLRCRVDYTTWTDFPDDNENLPIVCVSWFEAMAFCIWDGGYLPTATESMYAMVGGSQQRAYPWSKPASSTALTCANANYGGTNWPTTACSKTGATPVGSKSPAGDGAFGQADLGGNAMEWALDWSEPLSAGQCNDCAELDPASSVNGERRLRGGSYQRNEGEMRGASHFNGLPPMSRETYVGVRCARPTR